MHFEDKEFGPDDEVHLCGNSFKNCKVNGSKVIFSGDGDVDCNGVHYISARFTATGGAAAMLSLLQAFYQMPGGAATVELTFEGIRQGKYGKDAEIPLYAH